MLLSSFFSYTTYVGYEKNEREPNSEALVALADFFNCSVDYLIGRSDTRVDDDLLDRVNETDDNLLKQYGNIYEVQRAQSNNILQMPNCNRVPLIGTIACGSPTLAVENIEGYVGVPEFIHADFALRCKGDSMINARILDGDIVYICSQPDCENGEIAAVLIDGEATLKRVYKSKNKLTLMPENPAFEPLVYVNEELNEIKILGKAVYFTSAVK